MRTVHKFKAGSPLGYLFQLDLPYQAKFLMFAQQNESLYLWFEVDEYEKRLLPRLFQIFATGQSIDDNGFEHRASLVDATNSLVWHLYESVGA